MINLFSSRSIGFPLSEKEMPPNETLMGKVVLVIVQAEFLNFDELL